MNNKQTREKIRVLVVDDSALMRKRLMEMINHDNECEAIGTARNGEEALKMVQTLKPDVVTLDVEMKGMDGLTCLGYIMSEWPTPVVMVSAFTQYGSETTFKALEFGAIDYVSKPSGAVSLDINSVSYELLSKIKIAANVDISKLNLFLNPLVKKTARNTMPPLDKLIIIGSSTGGPRALSKIIPALDPNINAGLIVIQHQPDNFSTAFANRLNNISDIDVVEAKQGEALEAGKVFIAPSGYHLVLNRMKDKNVDVFNLTKSAKEHGMRPSVDVTMSSAANLYGKNIIGIILTGMGEDGTAGLKMIKEYGGKTIVENPNTCVAWGMPSSAIKAGVADEVVALQNISRKINKILNLMEAYE